MKHPNVPSDFATVGVAKDNNVCFNRLFGGPLDIVQN